MALAPAFWAAVALAVLGCSGAVRGEAPSAGFGAAEAAPSGFGAREAALRDDVLQALPSTAQALLWQLGAADGCEGALDCWLKSIEFVVPDIDIPDVMGFHFTMKGLTCHGISVAGIDSLYHDPASVDVKMKDAGTSCTGGSWKLKGWVSYSGTVDMTVSHTTVELDAGITPNERGVPYEAALRSCSVDNIKIRYHFHGSFIGSILDLLESKLTPMIEKGIKKDVCAAAATLVNEDLTDKLQQEVGPALEALAARGPSPPPPLPEGLVDWNSSAALGLADRLLNDVIGAHVNDLVDAATNGTGRLRLDLHDATTTVPISDPAAGALGSLTVVLHDLQVGGADSFRGLSLLAPSALSPAALESSAALGALEGRLNLTLRVAEEQGALSGAPLSETFVLSFAASDVHLHSTLVLGVSEEAALGLMLGQLSQPRCLADALRVANLTSLDLSLSLDELLLAEPRAPPLEADVDALVNNLLLLATQDFRAATASALRGAAPGPRLSRIHR